MKSINISERNKDLIILIILFLLIIILLSSALDGSKILAPMDILNLWYPWKLNQPADWKTPSNWLLSDQPLQFIPWRMYTSTFLYQGVIPLWNPYNYCGAPFVGNHQSAIFYPINWMAYLLPMNFSLLFSAIMKFIIAGLGMYYFLRQNSLGRLSALFGGIAFMFCGFHILWLGHPHTNVFIWLPWILLLIDRLYSKITVKLVLLLGILIGIIIAGGHPETALLVLLTSIGYFLFQFYFIESRPKRKIYVLSIIISLLLGLLLSGIQWLPTLDYLQNSSALLVRLGDHGKDDFLNIRALFTWLIPDIFGNPAKGTHWLKNEVVAQMNYNESVSGYVGITTLLLAIFGIVLCKNKRIISFFIGLGVLALLIAFHFPIIGEFISNLPVIKLIHPKRLIILAGFSLCVIASFGLEGFLKGNILTNKSKFVLYILLILLIFTTIIMVGYSFQKGNNELFDGFCSFMTNGIHDSGFNNIDQIIFSAVLSSFIFLLCNCLIIGLRLWAQINNRIYYFSFHLLLVVDLILFGWHYNPVVNKSYLYPTNEIVKTIKEDTTLYRIVSLQEWTLFPPNTPMAYELYDVRGYDAVVPYRYEIYLRQAGIGFWKDPGERIWRDIPDAGKNAIRMLSLINVKYIINDKPIEDVNLELISKFENIHIYKNPLVFTRGYIVPKAIAAKNDRQVLSLLLDTTINLKQYVILEKPIIDRISDIDFESQSVDVNYVTPNHIQIKIHSLYSGYLFLSENYDKGWYVKIKNRKIKPWRANYSFMAIPIEKGEYKINFYYRPKPFMIGFLFSFLSLSGILIFFVMDWIKKDKL